MSPVTLTLKDSNLIISQDNQAYDVPPYQVWLQTLSGSDNIQTNLTEILNHQRPWTSTFSLRALAYDDLPSN